MTNKPSPFIVIEALDAGGSQTQIDQLARRLKATKYHVHQYHFPNETRSTGRLIYDKFLLPKNKFSFTRREQALLYIQDFFSRAEEMHQYITNQSTKNVIVSDRYYTSTLAYQAAGLSSIKRQQMLRWIKGICLVGKPSLLTPDLVIYLDTPVAISVQHLASKQKDYHENKQKLAIFRRSYLRLAQEEKWTVVNCVNDSGQQRTIQDIHQEIWHMVQPHLKR